MDSLGKLVSLFPLKKNFFLPLVPSSQKGDGVSRGREINEPVCSVVLIRAGGHSGIQLVTQHFT